MNDQTRIQDVKEFFEAWKLYVAVVENDYMIHARVIQETTRCLQRLGKRPLNVLDLGCGDSYTISRAAQAIRIREYTGIDLSQMALDHARQNMQGKADRQTFVCGDMSQVASTLAGPFDAIVAGYTIHHLQTDAKRRLFSEIRRMLSSTGTFILYDEISEPDETRDAYLARAVQHFDTHWTALDTVQLHQIREHVTEYDYPETWHSWQNLAAAHGFSHAELHHLDEHHLFGIMEFRC